MRDRLMIMNFDNQCIGHIERKAAKFVQDLNGQREEFSCLPRIMSDIAPAPTQFPAANDSLEYFGMPRFDVWEFFKRSNGFKSSRDVWFMAEPPGEVWIPLVVGMQKRYSIYEAYRALFNIGDPVKVLMNCKAYINHHTIDILPKIIGPHLIRDGKTRFSTATGYVKDLVEHPSIKGLIGRIVLNMPKNS